MDEELIRNRQWYIENNDTNKNTMANFWLKMKLIIWKNLIIRKRRWIFTTFEIVLPVLLYVILASLNSLIPEFQKQYVNETYEYQIEDGELRAGNLFFTPNNSWTNDLMTRVQNMSRYNCDACEFRGFDNEDQMVNYILDLKDVNYGYYDTVCVAFNNPDKTLPKKLDYRIRSQSASYMDMDRLYSSQSPFQAYENHYYEWSKFVPLQKAVDTAFINMNKPDLEFEITYQQMPDPPHWRLFSLSVIFSQVMPICTVFAFMLVFVGIIQRVMEEKASGIKELMKMMGLKAWMLWVGWYIHSILAFLISITAITIIMKVTFAEGTVPLIEHGDGFLLWIFFFLYGTSGICFCFMVSTWFKKPMLGSSVGTLVWILTTVPVALLEKNDDPNSLWFVRNFILLFPNSCLNYGFKTLYDFEEKAIGMQWSNLYSVPTEYYPYQSMGKIFLMLVVDSLIFLILTWYIDSVNPGDYGLARSWLFPFQKSYWCPRVEQSPDTGEDTIDSRDEVEAVSPDLSAGIKIRNLHKEFNKKKAVNGLNLDVYNNQITVLLGHNGAGKTTTMNIVTGMISPSSGSVIVDGYSVRTNIDQVRESLGLCPQHNVQFPDLTVVEHLMFFAMLKGMPEKRARKESLNYLSRLCMSAKRNKRASTLSGGMRRRLSLGMALVGNTKVLMLDEPTSGMDPEARREIWDLLLSMRGERTILITTHYMEEADILGDRIAIMHSGQLVCYGTSLFLKKHYGTGYTLSILLARDVDTSTLTTAISTFVPHASVKSVSVGSVKYELPTSDTTALSNLFSSLEDNKDELGIASFGVSITTMDDVFLKVGKIADEYNKELNTNSDDGSETMLLNGHNNDNLEKHYNTGFSLIMQQFWALFLKRILYSRYKLFIFVAGIIMPIIFEVLTIISSQSGNNLSKNISRELHLKMYPDTQTFYSFDQENNKLAEYYKKIVEEQHSKPTVCPQVSDAIVVVGEENIDKYHSTLIAAAEMNYTDNKMVLNAMYGRFPVHSPPISMNLLTNALVKYAMNDDYSITVENNPLPEKSNFGLEVNGIIWMTLYPMGITLFVGILLGFHTAERLSGIKHLQIMSGVSRIMYWLNNYVFDMLIYILVTIITIIVLVILDESFTVSTSLLAFTVFLIVFGLALFPFTYFFHYRPTAGSVVTFTIWAKIIFGTILPIVIVTWEYTNEKKEIREALTYIFMLCPHFAFSYGMNRLAPKAAEIYKWDNMPDTKRKSECSTNPKYACCIPQSDECKNLYNFYAGDKSILTPVLFLIGEIFFYFAIFLFVDYGILKKIFDSFIDLVRGTKPGADDNNLDSDVIEERRRIAGQINGAQRMSSDPNHSDVLLVSNLRKWFGKFHAVKGLNFGVQESECFGLLGINGAGKTTTFKMLTGEIFVSTGTAKILEYSLLRNQKTYLKQIGYCPQFDAFNFELTTRQMLTFFAQLRGIPEKNVKSEVTKWLNKFDIMKYESTKSFNLSGGNKRKLSTAIALIGDPPLIMLDEPTSGVDPVARRNLWSILATMRKSGQAIVLTSHSMDECEALCDRLAIMVDGQMKCIGDIQYLKNKFGQGFTAMIKLRHITSIQNNENGDNINFETEVKNLKTSIENRYICTLKDEHKGMIMYHITDTTAKISEIFKFMEGLKQNKAIVEDFTVGDTSLEQVFLSFAKEKIAAVDKIKKRDVRIV